MNNDRITQKQGVIMIVMFIIGSSSLLVTGLEAKMDLWITIILAIGVGVLIMMMYSRLHSALPNKDFFELIEYYFGKIGSKIIIFLFTWFSFDLCALVLRNYAQFVTTVGLPETPLVIAMFILIIVSINASKSGLETIARWTESFTLFVIGFLIIGVILMTKNMNFSHLQPVLDNGVQPIINGTISVLTLPFAQLVIMLLVLPAFKTQDITKRVFVKGLLIGGSLIFITSVADILVLGTTIAENKYYPSYSTMATVDYGDFFLERLEFIAAIVFVISVFFKITVLLYGTCKGTARLFGFKNPRFITIPIAFLIVNYAILDFKGTIQFHDWTFKAWPYQSAIFELVLPLIVLIIIEIKRRRNKGRVTS